MGKIIIPDEAVELCPEELPEGLLPYCRNTIQPEDATILYRSRSRKGFCYSCGCHVTDKFINGSRMDCPRCGRRVVVYTETFGNWDCKYVANLMTIQRGPDDTLWLREWHINRRLHRIDIDEGSLTEIARYAIRGNAVAKWQHEDKECWGMASYRVRLKSWKRMQNVSHIYDYQAGSGYYFYLPENWQEIVAGTELQYCDLAQAVLFHRLNIARFLLDWVRYPAIEKIWKAGFTRLVEDKSNAYDRYHQIKWGRKSLQEALGCSLHYMDSFYKNRPAWTLEELNRLRKLQKFVDAGELDGRDLPFVFGLAIDDLDWIKPALPFAPVRKIAAYIQKNTIMDYRDYLRLAVEMQLDLRSTQILFPADLHAAEQALLEQKEWKDNQKIMEAFTAYSKTLEKLKWSNGSYLIRPARSPAELKMEGDALHHCVVTYAKRMSERDTAIMLIREKEHPEIPFYTLELRNGRVVQCRTRNNASYMGTEVEAFVKAWLEKKKI